MNRPRPDYIPAHLKTLDQVEEWAQASGLDFYDVLWAWATMGDLYDLAARSGITVTELTTRMLAARGAQQEREHVA